MKSLTLTRLQCAVAEADSIMLMVRRGSIPPGVIIDKARGKLITVLKDIEEEVREEAIMREVEQRRELMR